MSRTNDADARLFFPATARNREPIAAELAPRLPGAGTILEIASGSGEHIVEFAARFGATHPDLCWIPSDIEAEHLASIEAWTRAREVGARVATPLRLDVHDESWPLEGKLDAIYCANMIHIAPASASEGLLRGAATHLRSGAALFLYGPFTRDGRHTAPSNEAFDLRLRERNADWGVRDLETLSARAAALGLEREVVVEMPANNLFVVFRRD